MQHSIFVASNPDALTLKRYIQARLRVEKGRLKLAYPIEFPDSAREFSPETCCQGKARKEGRRLPQSGCLHPTKAISKLGLATDKVNFRLFKKILLKAVSH